MQNQIQSAPKIGQNHVFLENILKDTFGVYLEVYHTQFKEPISISRNKRIRARTVVMAYRSKEEALASCANPGTVKPLAITSAECSIEDQFVKKIGLEKAYRRLYKQLVNIRKEGLL